MRGCFQTPGRLLFWFCEHGAFALKFDMLPSDPVHHKEHEYSAPRSLQSPNWSRFKSFARSSRNLCLPPAQYGGTANAEPLDVASNNASSFANGLSEVTVQLAIF